MTTHELARALLATPECPAIVAGREVGEIHREVRQYDPSTGEYLTCLTAAQVGRGSALSGFVVSISAKPAGLAEQRCGTVTYQAYIHVEVDLHNPLPWKPVGEPQKTVGAAVEIAQSAGNNVRRQVLRQEPGKDDTIAWNTEHGYIIPPKVCQ